MKLNIPYLSSVKRSALILLTAIYLISCLGMSANRFYCCGKLASTTFSFGAGDNNSRPNTKDKCCGHEKQSFKIKDNHFNASSFSLTHTAPAALPSLISFDHTIAVTLLQEQIVYNGNAPPGYTAVPVYTLNCTYRI